MMTVFAPLFAQDARHSFDLPAGPALASLKEFIVQSRVQLLYVPGEVEGVVTNAVKGDLTPREAIRRLLEGTTLTAVQTPAGAIAVSRVSKNLIHGAPTKGASTEDTETQKKTVKKNNLLGLIGAWLGLTAGAVEGAAPAVFPVPGDAGTIVGTVSSAETLSMLQGAAVSLPAQGKQVLTDNAGRFVISGVREGSVEIVVTYTGFEPHRQRVTVSPSEPTRLSIEMHTSAVLTLGAYTVSTEREGHALAITQQRNAANVKNVMAMDALGNLPTANVGELLVQMSGISGVLDVEGNVQGVSVRGMGSALTQLNIDGQPSISTTLMSFSGGLYEELEVIKGQTPDKSADSIGGMLNLKTRSTLSMRDKRRITYNLSARWAAPFFDRTPLRARHAIHPLTNFAYQEVFDAWGGSRNLGVSVSLSYHENANDRDWVLYDYRNSDQLPNFLWDYRTSTGYNRRHVTSANVKAEYQYSDASKFQMSFIYNHGEEPGYDTVDTRAFTNQTVASLNAAGQPTGTGGIMPGFTDTVTQVRGVAASFFEINSRSTTFFRKSPALSLSGEHKYGPWEIDYHARYQHTRSYSNAGKKGQQGQLVMRVPSVGWIIDRSDPANPVFTQTEGANIYNIESYTSNIQFTMRNTTLNLGMNTFESNVKYRFDTRYPIELKGGLSYREETRDQRGNPRVWNRTAGAPSLSTGWLSDSRPRLFGDGLPVVESRGVNRELGNVALWTENLYYRESQKYILDHQVRQRIPAAYAMVQGRVSRFGYLGGVRLERTKVSGSAYIRGPVATAAQIPDPVARAIHDYNNPVAHQGSYDRSFPSVHAFYEFSRNLTARASWSTSFGRPGLNNLVPTATINDTAQTVSARNPGIGPQYARNIDLSLEYYFEPAGLVSLGYFRKNIRDYIVTTQIGTIGDGPDNGFSGLYAGYTLSSTINAGTADVEGWEFNYRQQLTFLPGLLRGIGVSGNYTELTTKGDFGGASTLRTNEVAGFIPKTANASLTYNYKKFGSRLTLGYNSDYLSTYNANPTARIYREALTTLNAGLSYRWSPKITFYVDATNITEETVSFYRYVPAQFRESRRLQTAVIFGVSGRF